MTGFEGTGSLYESEKESQAVAKAGASRVSLAELEANIAGEEVFRPAFAPHVTIVAMHTKSGYVVTGMSAPADPGNFDEALGLKLARDDAKRQLWPLMGYALREKLHADG